MITYVYYRHHEKHEDTYEDNELMSVLGSVIHDFDFNEAALESLTLAEGTVLTEIEEVEWHLKRLKEEGVKDR